MLVHRWVKPAEKVFSSKTQHNPRPRLEPDFATGVERRTSHEATMERQCTVNQCKVTLSCDVLTF